MTGDCAGRMSGLTALPFVRKFDFPGKSENDVFSRMWLSP